MSPVIVVCTGPESSGKSTLSQLLAEALQVPLVEEQARTYLDSKDAGRNGYLPSDILEIGRRQSDQEKRCAETNPIFVCDTDHQVLRIWWQEKYGPHPAPFNHAGHLFMQVHRFYLLCHPDFPWAPDPLREHPNDRDRLLRRYEIDCKRQQLKYFSARGQVEKRVDDALAWLQDQPKIVKTT